MTTTSYRDGPQDLEVIRFSGGEMVRIPLRGLDVARMRLQIRRWLEQDLDDFDPADLMGYWLVRDRRGGVTMLQEVDPW
jgi:hypothetical protein